MTAEAHLTAFNLDEKYTADSGPVLLSGIQALVRALQTRAQLDRSQNLQTGGFVSGYRGSPLGGLDKELWAQSERLESHGIHFQPGVNEDLAATAVWGSQQVGLHAQAKVEGVYGMWYGKAPGLDRSCDAIRHANAWGTSAKGGVLLVVGDDPAAKSSSLATQSEFALQDMMVPVLHPSDVQDVLDFAVLGWEMSRYSGLWVGLKAIADHMDSAATVQVGVDRFAQFKSPAPNDEYDEHDVHIRREDTPLDQEQRLIANKLPLALEFARKAGLNRWVTQQHNASGVRNRLGIVCAGKGYRDVREACTQLNLHSPADIQAAGIEILKLGMTWPMDANLIKQFAANVESLLVVEEKRAFVEPQIKDILYAEKRRIAVLGKKNLEGKALLPETGILSVSDIAQILVDQLQLPRPSWLERNDQCQALTRGIDAPAKKERTPLFCAGCPHNTSTRVPQGSRATAGIGCHYMVQWMSRETDSCTQMGGEGITWVGESPFTEEKHIFANLGDGTYFHSGILAIRQAVAAKVNITYKILFNDAVAMTGGQPTDGSLTVADVVNQVRSEGVAKVVIVSDEPDTHADVAKTLSVDVYHRSVLDDVQRTLREEPGVTVLIYQQTCATELRRKRKRGLVTDDRPRLLINEAICEGCGDCSVQSNCVAVEPVETELGIKRKINQTNCNKDLSCATGFCPAFVEVSGELRKPTAAQLDLAALAEVAPPPQASSAAANIVITGVGGTGIVTLSALLAAAAKIDGKDVLTLDMTGLAQKGGAVFAHVRIGGRIGERIGGRIGERSDGETSQLHSPRIPNGCADVLVGCDLVSAASNESLELLSNLTHAVVNTHVTPTADFVLSQSHDVKLRHRMARVSKVVGTLQALAAEDHIDNLLGDTQQANIMLLGYAFQHGGIPLSIAAVEAAIAINGIAVERNLLAFHLGRIAAHDINKLPNPAPLKAARVSPLQLADLIEHRADLLTEYQSPALAERYRTLIERVFVAERAVRPGSEVLTRAVAESYAKLLAVKDEYEVARLHLAPAFSENLTAQFAEGMTVKYLLAPPLRGTKKRRFGGWMRGCFKMLSRMKVIRNTILDPFAYSGERKLALQLIADFEGLLDELLPSLNRQNLGLAVALAKLPLSVRGFGHVKVQHLSAAKGQQERLLEEFQAPPEPVRLFDPSNQAAA
jgi:indolepyruvate ferredoxin oxidoreductase